MVRGPLVGYIPSISYWQCPENKGLGIIETQRKSNKYGCVGSAKEYESFGIEIHIFP